MQLANSVALVTGGAVRIGRAITEALAAEGMRVVVHYGHSAEQAERLAAGIREGGGAVALVQADLARMQDVERLAREAERAFGRVDVLVNNASVFPAEGLDEVDEALWDHTFAVNLKAPFFLTQRLARGMRERGGGVVINLGDLAGIQAWKGYAAHALSKAALLHLTRVAARVLAPEVRVAAIAPGTVLPPEAMPDEQIRRLAERTPLRRNGSPDDVARAVLYLLHSDYVTGEVMVLDGGRTLEM